MAGFIGRVSGGALVTNRVLFGRYSKYLNDSKAKIFKKIGYTMGTASASFLYTMYGQIILGIAKGHRNIEDLMELAVTGNFQSNHCIDNSDISKKVTVADRKMVDDFMLALYELSRTLEKPPISIKEFPSATVDY
ncbi:hypothetical protein [Hahella ganghwensis]|uniref:hypothetical protein n=1 Tax=Hahella ganghwensis TaxID=286420 RepID=UPI0012F9C027|nr:hypothetical protein [Hahella ganghwensis]